MNRLTIGIAVLLALLTGLVLIQIGDLALRPIQADSRPSPQALTIAQSFYDDLNNVLATGDASLDSAVASDFVEHTPDGDGNRTLPQMIDRLLDMRATWPDLRFSVIDLEEHDRLVSARLKIDPGEPAAIPGIPLEAATAGESLEFLQIEHGGVTARWETSTPVATVDLRAEIPWNDPSFDLPAMQKIALDPGDSVQISLDASVVFAGETGAVILNRDGVDALGINRSSLVPLQAGDVRILEGQKDRVVTISSAFGDPAALWVLSTGKRAVGESAAPGETPEPGHPSLVAFLPVQRPSSHAGGAAQLSIVRLILPPGAAVPVHQLGAIEEIAVLDGSIEVTIGEGRALLCRMGSSVPFDGSETIIAGEGVGARESTSLGYHVTGLHSATILVMRVQLTNA